MSEPASPTVDAAVCPPRTSGTYALLLRNPASRRLMVGRWRELEVRPGYYIYIGSAFGPGGLRARLNRHFRDNKAMHWHIDYLRSVTIPVGAWISYKPDRLEHSWAQRLESLEGLTKIPGFGCSDCNCSTHLFLSAGAPDRSLISKGLGGEDVEWITVALLDHHGRPDISEATAAAQGRAFF